MCRVRMTTSTPFCLACGLELLPSNKRKLCSETSAESVIVRRVWRGFLAEKLGESFIQVEGEIESMMKGTTRDPGCVCKKCFFAIKAFYLRRCQFLATLDAAIDKMPLCISQSAKASQGRKRACTGESNYDEAVKRRRLISDSSCSSGTQSSPGVQITIGYKRPKIVALTPSRKKLGKRLARGSSVSVALECVKDRNTRKHVVAAVGKVIRNEIKQLCSRNAKSVQRTRDAIKLKQFNWDAIVSEAIEHAPNLTQILMECTKTTRKQSKAVQTSIVGMCLSILCKHRNPQMTMFQRIVSLVLYAGHSAKQVFNRLHKLHLCSSHRDTLKCLDILGSGYDAKVNLWRDELTPRIIQSEIVSKSSMQELPKETISALFAVREDDAESNSDFSMDFSLDSDPQDWGNYTSTPVKLDDTTNLGSDASSPASFSGPSFSFIEDSDEQQSLHESTTEMTGTQCSCLLSQPQDNSNSSIQPHQISVHYSQPNANLCLNDLQLTSSQPEASVNTQNRPDQISSSCNQPENSANVTSIGSTSTSTTSTLPIARGIKIVGDNVDKMVKTRYMRVDKQGKSLHYFHAYAAQDRFDLTMPEEVPSTPDSPDLNELLPSNYDKSTMKNLFAIHVARILCKYMPFFSEDFSDVIPENLEHPMSSEMSEKSQVAPLGVYLKNENKLEEIVDILDELQKFAPSKSRTVDIPVPNTSELKSLREISFHRLLFGGDQLTAKRARAGIRIRNNSVNSSDRLEGLLPVSEDWHAKVVFLEIVWKRLYKSTSASDIGTIFQLRNLINRKNIGNKPKNDVNAHEDFFHLLVESHVLAAAIEFLGMENIDDVPPVDIFPPTAWMLSQEERRDMLMSVCEAMVEEFVDIRTFEAKQDKQQPDKVQAYAKEVLSFGLLYKELVDAVRQGDGLRVLRWWKFMLLIFKATDRRNYSIEAFIIQAQYNYLLSPRQQHQLLYSRFINTHGLPGRNISCDLYMEHLNRLLKDAIRALGANKTPKAITRLGKCIAPLGDLLDNYDNIHKVSTHGTDHFAPSSEKDLICIIKELNSAEVFRNIPGREHRSFSNFKNNPVLSLKKKDVDTWLKVQWTKLLAGLL